MFAFLFTLIPCATYAALWTEPPELCEPSLDEGNDACDTGPLTVTNSLQAVNVFTPMPVVVSIYYTYAGILFH